MFMLGFSFKPGLNTSAYIQPDFILMYDDFNSLKR